MAGPLSLQGCIPLLIADFNQSFIYHQGVWPFLTGGKASGSPGDTCSDIQIDSAGQWFGAKA